MEYLLYYNNPDNRKNFFQKIINKISRILTTIRNWGHIKLSVMLVPHSEKKIFNFQISNFTIMFSIILLFGLITTSVFAIRSQKDTSRKKDILLSENVTISEKLYNFIKLTNSLKKNEKNLKAQLLLLIHNSGSTQKSLSKLAFPDTTLTSQKSFIKHKNVKIESIEEINKLKRLIKKVSLFNYRLKQIQTQINGFKKIMRRIPSIWPIFGGVGRFASGFGMRRDPFTGAASFHTGVDIVTMPGHPVRATASGKVITATYNPQNGNYVDIQHDFGYMTNYSHLLRLNVKEGDYVKKNQIIGFVGTTGRSTGYHLHYEVRVGYTAINPAQFLYLDKFHR